MWTLGLKTRCGIGIKMLAIIDPKSVATTGTYWDRAGKIPGVLRREGMKCPRNIFRRTFFEDDVDALRFRRPNPEMGFVRSNQFGADGIVARARVWVGILPPRRHGLFLRLSNFSFHRKNRQLTMASLVRASLAKLRPTLHEKR